jgi:hypothetical protein
VFGASRTGSVLNAATRVWNLPVVICCMSTPLSPIPPSLAHSIIKHTTRNKSLKIYIFVALLKQTPQKIGGQNATQQTQLRLCVVVLQNQFPMNIHLECRGGVRGACLRATSGLHRAWSVVKSRRTSRRIRPPLHIKGPEINMKSPIITHKDRHTGRETTPSPSPR